jgi:hypothetical protein
MYIAYVSFALGAAGTAAGFTLGVVPYFRGQLDVSRYDEFFLGSVAIGTIAGFIVGAFNGSKWFRASEVSPLIQRRMLAYMQRRNSDARGVPQRTINAASLRKLIGSRAPRQI